MTIYTELTEKLMQYYTSGSYHNEAVKAKIQFNEYAGVFDEAASNFEMKLAQFVDWYLFTRPLKEYGLSPIVLQAERGGMPATEEENAHIRNIANNRHSLFEFLKISKEDLHVRDLFSDYKLVIKQSPIVHGFDEKEPFEGRLIPHGDSFVFASAFCFHPKESVKFITQELKKVKKLNDDERPKAREELLIRLFRMRHKYEQYPHVAIDEIYTNEPRMKF
jgi:hypothetical protein